VTPLLEADGLKKSFGDKHALNSVSFALYAGEIVGLLGSNGAGKSTTMRILAGVLEPDAGAARVAGVDMARHRRMAQANLGYLPEAASGFDVLTTAEFLRFAAEARGLTSIPEDLICGLELSGALGQRLGTLSKGWRQRVWLAQALIHDPAVLILDEPTDGLDPLQKARLHDYLRGIISTKAILMSTHILEEAEILCDRFIVMRNGQVVADRPKVEFEDADHRIASTILPMVTSHEADGARA